MRQHSLIILALCWASAVPCSKSVAAQPLGAPAAVPDAVAPVPPTAAPPAPPPPPTPAPTPPPSPAAGPAATGPTAPPAAAPPASTMRPVDAMAQGTCRTPREAWAQLLYWLQQGTRWEPRRAAACFEVAGLSPARLGERAVMLKRVLDARPTWLVLEDIPDRTDHLDAEGQARYVDANVARDFAGVTLIQRDGRWLFSSATVARIPALYPEVTGRLERYMPSVLMGEFLGIELWKYLGLFVMLVVGLLLQRVVVYAIQRWLARRLARARARDAVDKASKPIGVLATALVFRFGVPLFLFPPKVSEVATVATEALAAFSVVWLAYRLVDVLADFLASKAELTETKLDDQIVPLVSRSLKVFTWVVGAIFVLQNINVDVGSLLTGLGLGGLAFALAAKDTVANFFGSVMIFVDRPFQIGDWVVVAGVEGIIEEVGFRSTRVRTFYNSVVTMPNAKVVDAMIDNYGARKYRRYTTTLGLAYDTPPDKVQAFCEGARAIIAGLPETRKDYYLVEFKDFGESTLDVMVYCFFEVSDWNAEMRARNNMNLELLRLASELGVSYAFPTRTLHVDTLAALGEARPSHRGPTEAPALAAVIDGFGPRGGLARPRGVTFSEGYDNRAPGTTTVGGDG
ncbi:MAG: mechanosensitive ion channel family protein [Kofleriaceae bacterium]